MLNGKSVLLTGGTGSFGRKCVETVLSNYQPRKLIVFSRDELKQYEMAQVFSTAEHPCLRYFLGDVRDYQRLNEAMRGVDIVVHAAAIKHIPAAEYNPFEAIKTNVLGGQNVIQAAIEQGVEKVVALSTDKAANPVNLYGATKLCSDKLFVAGNAMAGEGGPRLAVVRYGNVACSRGSVIPFFVRRARQNSVLPVTDKRMTRFNITLAEGVELVLHALEHMHGGEIYVPKIPSYRILDVARAVAPDADVEYIGIRPGEKLHELMIPEDEARHTVEFDDHYIIQPDFHWWQRDLSIEGGTPCEDGFSYSSDNNRQWMTVEDIRKLVDLYIEEYGIA
jgi:UDP-N-acetylglucosamine 4,6-dehydratase/5-epimerase